MITLELVKYIEAQINKNTPREVIVKNLSDSGWHIDDIEEGFTKAFPAPVEKVATPVEVSAPVENKIEIQPIEISDPYRELPDIDSKLPNIVSKNIQEAANPNEPKVWVPMTVKPAEEITPEVKIETPKIEIKPISLNDIINPTEPTTSDELSLENQIDNNNSEINNNAPIIQEPVVNSYLAPSLSAFSFNQNKKSFSDFKPKVDSDISSGSSEKDLSARKPIVQVDTTPAVSSVVSQPSIQETQTQSSPILSTLKQDMISSFNKNDQFTVSSDNTDNKKKFKTIAIILAILLIIGGTVFAFIGGCIKLPFSLIKTDPKIVLLSSTTSFDNLKSYKTNTTISLSSPSFANITSGLVNGEAVVSNDRDSISIDTKGLINRVNSSSTISDYNSVIKSSFLKGDISTDIKYDGNTSYISVPDLSSSFDEGAYPNASNVAVANGQFGLITPELSAYAQDKIAKLDAFNILSNIMSTSFSGKFSSSFKDFISSATMVEKKSEVINGQNTYHYEISVDKVNTKKFLVSLMNTFANTISADVKTSLEESLGSANVDSFEIWVGASDSNIVQYKFTLSAPLSKIIGLDDKGIADNTVKLDWKTTYSDFNVANEITIPTDYIKAEDYIKSIRDAKIKNIISTFSSSAKTLFNAEGSYGKHLNKSGSCLSPDSGSLFSPLGHISGASTAVSTISGKMNDLLSLTGGQGSCYSTLNAWSLSAPLVSNPQAYLCADSTGSISTLSSAPNSVSCTAPIVTQPVVTTPVTSKTTSLPATVKAPAIPTNVKMPTVSDPSTIVPPLPISK